MVDWERTREKVSVEGGYCSVARVGAGQAVLMLHAGIADSRMWQPQFEGLGQQHFCLAPDLRGYGQSPLPDIPFSYLADIERVLEHFEINRCWLVGASFGSSLAVKFCLKHPERVAGMVLIAPTLDGFKPSPLIENFWQQESELLARGDLAAATELNLKLWFDGPARSTDQVDAGLRQQVGVMQLAALEQPEPARVELLDESVADLHEYAAIEQKTVLIVGAEDVPAVLDHAQALLGILPHARLERLSRAGHMVSMERAERVNQILAGVMVG